MLPHHTVPSVLLGLQDRSHFFYAMSAELCVLNLQLRDFYQKTLHLGFNFKLQKKNLVLSLLETVLSFPMTAGRDSFCKLLRLISYQWFFFFSKL